MVSPQTLRAATFGVLDGLITVLALVLGVYQAGISSDGILLTSIVAAVAGACSMCVGEIVSVHAYNGVAEDQANPYVVGAASLVSFLVGSGIVILPIVLGLNPLIIGLVGMAEMIVLGYISTKEHPLWQAARTVALGSTALLITLGLGQLAGTIVS